MVYCKAPCSLIELFQRLVVDVEWRPLYDLITMEVSPKLHDLLLISATSGISAAKALFREISEHLDQTYTAAKP